MNGQNMTYLDILSDSLSHFTDIPKDFIKSKFYKVAAEKTKDAALLKSLMEVEFPENEGKELADYLKGLELRNTIQYFTNSLKMYRDEIIRQSKLN